MTEFVGLDMEMTFFEHYHEVLDMLDRTFCAVFDGLNQSHQEELAAARFDTQMLLRECGEGVGEGAGEAADVQKAAAAAAVARTLVSALDALLAPECAPATARAAWQNAAQCPPRCTRACTCPQCTGRV